MTKPKFYKKNMYMYLKIMNLSIFLTNVTKSAFATVNSQLTPSILQIQ